MGRGLCCNAYRPCKSILRWAECSWKAYDSGTMRPQVATGLLAFALVGCDDGPGARPDAPPKPPRTSPSDASSRAERPRVPRADPPEPDGIEEAARAKLPEDARAEILRAGVPVLVVNEARLLAGTTIATGPSWVEATIRDGACTIAIHATRLSRPLTGDPPSDLSATVRGRPAFLTSRDGLVAASWVEDGVAYALDLTCADRFDARCRTDAHLLDLAAQLVVVSRPADPR